MTRDEESAIEWDCAKLILLYAQLNDAQAWDEVAALYTEDGVFARPTAPDTRIFGRDAILAGFTSRPPRYTRHVCANIIVQAQSAFEATATSTILLFTGTVAAAGALPTMDAGRPLVGQYKDRLILTSEGWRFRERLGEMFFA